MKAWPVFLAISLAGCSTFGGAHSGIKVIIKERVPTDAGIAKSTFIVEGNGNLAGKTITQYTGEGKHPWQLLLWKEGQMESPQAIPAAEGQGKAIAALPGIAERTAGGVLQLRGLKLRHSLPPTPDN